MSAITLRRVASIALLSSVLSPLLCLPNGASAAGVTGGWSGYRFIEKGVFDLGVENLLLFRFNSTPIKGTGGAEDGEVSSTDVAYQGGVTGRYFVIRNLAVGLSANFFIRQNKEETDPPGPAGATELKTSDSGFIGFAMAHYYVSLGNSFFLTPGIGAGYFAGTRETPVSGSTSQVDESSISGPAGRLDLGAVFYAGPQFNLKAGLNIVGRFGAQSFDKPAGGGPAPDSVDFTTFDAAFNIGLGYSF